MQKKKLNSLGGLVYSTDPNFKLEEDYVEAQETLPPAQQKLRILLDKKQRAGKAVTLVTGFIGVEKHIEELGKKLKTFCGTGGSVKEGEIIVQGDNRDKVLQWLLKNGYSAAKKI
ncbi:MAG: translation initiation factor [Chitinophagaceae bacterium]|nr:translation initiation factor [Chitinophagaceae bacterium]